MPSETAALASSCSRVSPTFAFPAWTGNVEVGRHAPGSETSFSIAWAGWLPEGASAEGSLADPHEASSKHVSSRPTVEAVPLHPGLRITRSLEAPLGLCMHGTIGPVRCVLRRSLDRLNHDGSTHEPESNSARHWLRASSAADLVSRPRCRTS